jgi:hypothetical protein
MNIFNLLKFYNAFSFSISLLKTNFLNNFLIKTHFLFNYYLFNELIWEEGFLFDFLQKKIVDNWLKKFVICSANLFSERLVFDKVIRFYLDLLIWPMHKMFVFEFNNVSGTLFINLFVFFFSFFFFSLIFFFFI